MQDTKRPDDQQALQRAAGPPLSQLALDPGEVQRRIARVREIKDSVMIRGTHYGQVPGTPKPSLWLPGAEVLQRAFDLSAEVAQVEQIQSGPDCFHYRVHVEIRHIATGYVVGTGVGEASTDEEKYRWRAAVSEDEYAATDHTRKRIKFKRDGQIPQVRTNPADLVNTVVKMAEKRAKVDGIKFATAASEIFTQDAEQQQAAGISPDQNGATNGGPASRPATPDREPDLAAGKAAGSNIVGEAWDEIRELLGSVDATPITVPQRNRLFKRALDNGWNFDSVRNVVAAHLDGLPLEQIPKSTVYDKVVAIFDSYVPADG